MRYVRYPNPLSCIYATIDSTSSNNPPDKNIPLTSCLKTNIEMLQNILGDNPYIVIRDFILQENIQMALLYFNGLVDVTYIQNFISRASMREEQISFQGSGSDSIIQFVKQHIVTVGNIISTSNVEDIVEAIFLGNTILLFENQLEACIASTSGGEKRSITEPTSQNVVRGPRDGFTESLQTNIALTFRRIKNPKLRMKTKIIGTITHTDIALLYIKDIVDPAILNKTLHRIDTITIDRVLDSAYIEPYLLDTGYSPFPTIYHTERPDIVASALLEGRIAIVVDGSPFVLLVPSLFQHFLQSNEDYYQPVYFSLFIRVLRYFSFFSSMILPGVFMAITCFHQEMIPTPLLINLAAQRASVPFPPIIEMFLMEATFEIFREAGIRLPRTVGSAISIVGALVIGDAAVQAGIVSPATIIIVAFSAITNFVFPIYTLSLITRLLRFVFLFFASVLGLYGIMIGVILLLIHLCGVHSLGTVYFNSSSHRQEGLLRKAHSYTNQPSFLMKWKAYYQKWR